MSDQPNPLVVLSVNTVTVMTGMPEHKADWVSKIQRYYKAAQSGGDAETIELMAAILRVLGGEKPERIYPALAGDFAACWMLIVNGLRYGKPDPAPEDELNYIQSLLAQPSQSLLDFPHRVEMFRQGLELVNPAGQPELWAMLLNELANSLTQTPFGSRAENMEQAIKCYNLLLENVPRADSPEAWAKIQVNLASAFVERIEGERAENIEQAIQCNRLALEVFTREAFPEQWAAVQHNLAAAFSSRMRGERAENIEQAIEGYSRALQVRTRAALSFDWAMTRYMLGIAYRNRIRGERAENIEQAIDSCQQALEVRTRDAFPDQWALTRISLGSAYTERIRGDRAENIEQSIVCYTDSLEVYTREDLPERWAQAHYELAVACLRRVAGERSENIEQSIQHIRQALDVYTREALPERWAMCQNTLANAYFARIAGERTENIEQVIDFSEQALQVFMREAYPEAWAIAQNNLGLAHTERVKGKRADNIQQAIRYYSLALEVYTREATPSNHRLTQRNIGDLYFGERRWGEALDSYRAAIAAGDDLLAAAATEEGRRAEIGETAELYACAAFCLLQTGQYGEALVTHDHGKTRLLAEALALGDIDLRALPDAHRASLKSVREAIRALEAEMRLPPDTPSRRADRALAELLRQARADLNRQIESIRQERPDFMPIGLALPGILALIPEDAALVAPMITSQGSVVFMLPGGAREVTEKQVIRLDSFTTDDLHTLVWGTQEKMGWQRKYFAFRSDGNIEEWRKAIDSLGKVMLESLFQPALDRLDVLKVKRVMLLPSGGVQLMPLHILFIDQYEVSFAQSAYALDVSRRRAAERQDTTALVVGINDYADPNVMPLGSAVSEAQTIAAVLHAKPLVDQQATQEVIIEQSKGRAFLHLSCHGHFDWFNPLASGLICHDRMLTLSDIIGQSMFESLRLVVMSACETGITDVTKSPDEYIGLPAGFMQAGAPAVVSSLWTVDDRSTALLMERFYRNRFENQMGLAAALRDAQLWLRDQADGGRYANPFYWAAFTFTGAG